MNQNVTILSCDRLVVVTAGSVYLDIDAYACMVAMAELLELKGQKAIAYSCAICNYSVCDSLREEGQILDVLPPDCEADAAQYMIVDVSDPDYIKDAVPLDRVVAVYDHHVGFEEYWHRRIGDGACIEFIGAAATLIFREWKQAGLLDRMSRATALLLIAAILDNTLNLTSSNTTDADREAFRVLCEKERIGEEWRAAYFSEVQASVEADLKNALFHDLKTISSNGVLPPSVGQICIWDGGDFLQNLPRIRRWFNGSLGSWMLNIIDIRNHCSYFVCDSASHQKRIGEIFGIHFEDGVARTPIPYLRKEIIKKCFSPTKDGGLYND